MWKAPARAAFPSAPAVAILAAGLRSPGPTVIVSDCESRNGTLVDGRKITGTMEVTSGSEIVIGGRQLVAVVTGERPPSASAVAVAVAGAPFVARDPAMLRVLALADRAAAGSTTVLLAGETGVGKEVVARRIHERSQRQGAFVAVNCGAIPESLAESALFGHERGAFTGAAQRHLGYFEAAEGGTLFLDEVGELSAATQVRLLRVIQEREVQRVGGGKAVRVDVRLIAATNADLAAMVREGRFREDLLYRLDVLRIEIPPLRERLEDIVPLAQHFVRKLSPDTQVHISQEATEALRGHPWPGNVRDLRNVIERALAVRERKVIEVTDLRGPSFLAAAAMAKPARLRLAVGDTERETIVAALDACDGNQTKAARQLGISRRALIYKMERYGLKPPPGQRQD